MGTRVNMVKRSFYGRGYIVLEAALPLFCIMEVKNNKTTAY